MNAPQSASAPDPRQERLSFFRQGGWMMAANALAGACFTLVHTPAGRIASVNKSEYAMFGALLDALPLLAIPAGGLQAVFAQLAAGAVDGPRQVQLRSTVRRVLSWLTIVWIAAAAGVWLARTSVLEVFHISDPRALWLTLGAALVGLLFPVFAGILQGTQNFLNLGLASIASGAGRLIGVIVTVVVLGGLATGAMAGVLAGALAALVFAAWSSRATWSGPTGGRSDWSWLGSWAFLSVGIAAGSVMLTADSQLVQAAFSDEEKAFYVAAGRVGRGLVFLTMPLALVLFPRVARSAATGVPTGALKLALVATLGTGTAAAIVCSLFPELPLRCLYLGNPVFLPAAQLVPLFCWSMLPLAAAYTLVNSLLARRCFRAVPWLALVAIGYAVTLTTMRAGMVQRGSPEVRAEELMPTLFARLATPVSSLEQRIVSTFPANAPALTNLHTAAASPTARTALATQLNRLLDGPPLFSREEIAEWPTPPRPSSLALLAQFSTGSNARRLNRALLEDAFPDGLARKPERDLFGEFRRVLYALGGFSLLLLAVSVLFSLPRASDGAAARPA